MEDQTVLIQVSRDGGKTWQAVPLVETIEALVSTRITNAFDQMHAALEMEDISNPIAPEFRRID